MQINLRPIRCTAMTFKKVISPSISVSLLISCNKGIYALVIFDVSDGNETK